MAAASSSSAIPPSSARTPLPDSSAARSSRTAVCVEYSARESSSSPAYRPLRVFACGKGEASAARISGLESESGVPASGVPSENTTA